MKQKLKRLCLYCLAAFILVLGGPAVSAETLYGSSDWQVTFTTNIESNFKPSDMASNISDVVGRLESGDSAIFTITIANKNSKSTDWYMRNKVLSSMEDSNLTAEGGAYLYKLTYKDKDGDEKVFFDSTVGGTNISEAGEGLHGATGALQDYFYIDTLATNESGVVTLQVTLDPESISNGYQDSFADIEMNFAVELADDTPNSSTTTVVRTGDETNLLPLYAAMAVSGLVLLIFGIFSMRRDKRKGGG